MKYDHQRIEAKWQKKWKDLGSFVAHVDLTKPKYYVLDMFPFPSGAGLHVGHVTGYTATDIIARYKRQKGFNVLHPMGWDSFGLPAEQYAVRTGTHPAITTEENINTYRHQLQSLGLSYDWEREVATSDPKYYKWTQWIFTKLYERGLAYESEALVNYCPALGTVLANEEVEEGKSKEGGFPVERRPLRQWVLKITEYAERLIEDLDLVDWPDHIKRLQLNWIGKSQGAKISFVEAKSGKEVSIFTTCHDTIFGVTYLVLAPEHPLVKEITTPENREKVETYCREVALKSDMERTELSKDKTGVPTGAYARNPANGELIPIWVADYVLFGYGTGAVMGVPAHDERDFAFAKKYHLPIQYVIVSEEECYTGDGKMINSSSSELSIDGIENIEAKERVADWLEKSGNGERTTNYKLRDWLFSRQRYWGEPFPILHFADGTQRVLDLDELPLALPQVQEYKPTADGQSPLASVTSWVDIFDEKTGKKARRETNTMPNWAGSCWYYLRFCDPHNDEVAWGKEAEKYWMPVDLYVGGVEHAVLHLLYARFWHKVLYDAGLVSTPEPFQVLRNQGLVTSRSYKIPGGNYVLPEEVENKGGEYYQIGTGKHLFSQIEKMSKSRLNGTTPDEIIEEYGADSLRLYEMFMGPFDKEKLWSNESIVGCHRFLTRYFDLIYSPKVTDEEDPAGLKLAHRLVFNVEEDLQKLHFNTAIAKMMEFINAFAPLEKYSRTALKMLTQALNPLAPHITEEAWEHLGEEKLLAHTPYPKADPRYLEDETAIYVVQINGKMRGKWELPKNQSKENLLRFVENQPQIQKHITGEIEQVVYVPNKLLNFVLKG